MKAKILVIDDEENIRFTFQNFLVDEGYDVSTVGEYNKAIALIGKYDFDLIFADIILAGRSGIDFLEDAKKRKLSCPIVMITGAPDVETASKALRLGAFDYIPKPVLQDALLHAAKTALKHKAVIDEKERYRSNLEAIFMSVKDAIITVDRSMSVIEINEAAKSICDLPRSSIGEPFKNVTKYCDGKCVEVLEETVNKKKPVEIYRFECRHKSRPQQIMTINTYPLINNKGLFNGAVLVAKDETRLDGLEKEMKKRRRFHNIIGNNKKIQEVYTLIENLKDVQTTVLIGGETGTGKELVAEALHYKGARSRKILVKVGCSTLTEQLLESELFGHVEGAFTGAIKNRVGRFEMADGGTIFLDEIGDISPKMQSQLLRVIQGKVFERVGDSMPIKVDVRIVAATHQNLLEKTQRGEFRKDLYYRLKVVEINLPPLRERKEDIPLLVNHFLKKFNKTLNKEIEGISIDAQKALMYYSWPGNVRELENMLEQAFIVCQHKTITVQQLPVFLGKFTEAEISSMKGFGRKKREDIIQVLENVAWNKKKAAKLLGISRNTLYRKIKKYNIKEQNIQDGTDMTDLMSSSCV